MKIEEIRALMDAMEEKGMKKLEMSDREGFAIKLEREDFFSPFSSSQGEVAIPSSMREHSEKKKGEGMSKEEETGNYVTSPMVGTFYSRPSPDRAPFVRIGDMVEKDTIVCIIEAMKVMNEVKAGVAGKVVSVLVDDSHPVDFGTKLFQVAEEK